MLKSLKTSYFWQCISLAWKPSWSFANNVFGVALGGIIGVLLPIPLIPGNSPLVAWANCALSACCYVMAVWLILLMLRTVFISPYQLWKIKPSSEEDALRDLAAAQRENTEELRRQRESAERDNHPVMLAIKEKASLAMSGKKPPLIILGEGQNFQSVQSYKIYLTHRSISVSFRNVSSEFISNCKFYLEFTSEDGTKQQPHLLDGSFTLNPTEERYIPIATYNEAVAAHTPPEKYMQLSIRHGHFFNSAANLPAHLPHIITLRGTCKEFPAVEQVCKLWVQEGKMRLEKL